MPLGSHFYFCILSKACLKNTKYRAPPVSLAASTHWPCSSLWPCKPWVPFSAPSVSWMEGALCTAHPLVRTGREAGTKRCRQENELNVNFPFLFSSVPSVWWTCPGGPSSLLCSLKDHRRKVGSGMFPGMSVFLSFGVPGTSISYLWQQSSGMPGCLHLCCTGNPHVLCRELTSLPPQQ